MKRIKEASKGMIIGIWGGIAWHGKTLRLLSKILVVLAPALWGFFIVVYFGVNIYVAEEWGWIQCRDTFLRWSYLWPQHNEHRMLFPKILAYFIGNVSSWNSKAFMFASLLFLLLLYVVAASLLLGNKGFNEAGWCDICAVAILGFVVFDSCQYENMLWGFQTAWTMIIGLGAASFFFFWRYLSFGKWMDMIFSMLMAVVSSFSSMHGLSIWVGFVGLFALSIIFRDPLKKWDYLIPIVVGMATFAVYFRGWHSVSYHDEYMSKDIGQAVVYLLREVASPFLSDNTDMSLLLGFVLLAAGTLLILNGSLNGRLKENVCPIGAMIMGIASMGMVAIGRSGAERDAYVLSRYTTNGVLYNAFFFVLLAFFLRENEGAHEMGSGNIAKYAGTFVGCAVLLAFVLPILLLFRNLFLIKDMALTRDSRTTARIAVINWRDSIYSDFSSAGAISDDNWEAMKGIFIDMETNHIGMFAGNVQGMSYHQLDNLDNMKKDCLPDNFFCADNVSVESGKIRILVSQLSGYEPGGVRGYKYAVRINDSLYNAVYDSGRKAVFLSKDSSVLKEKVNYICFISYSRETEYESSPIILYKNGEDYDVFKDNLIDDRLLERYTKNEFSGNIHIDNVNGEKPDEMCRIGKDRLSTIRGWVQTKEPTGRRYVLCIGKNMFELDFEERKDVIDSYQDEDYAGFQGGFFGGGIAKGEYNPSILIVDDANQEYSEVSLDFDVVVE